MEAEPYLDEESEEIVTKILKKYGIVEYNKGWRAMEFIMFIQQYLLMNPVRALILLPYTYKHGYLVSKLRYRIDFALLQRFLPHLLVLDIVVATHNIMMVNELSKYVEYFINKLKENQDLAEIYFRYFKQLSLVLGGAAKELNHLAQIRVLDIEELMYVW